ncbi:MAG: DUF3696 domain-containing protein [Eubacteriales bacterium]|nr:DUF3696 domain-containing protein [Eubacteriales bacterium]
MIKKIVLKNFKCFDEIEIPFQKLTLLAGSNGSGKSTIIQSILVSAQSMMSSDGILDLMGEYIKLGYSNDVFYEFNEDQSHEMIISIEEEEGLSFLCANYESNKIKLKLLDGSQFVQENSCLQKEHFEYIAADRISPDKIFSVFGENERIGIHGEYVLNYLNSFGNKEINGSICDNGVDAILILQLDYWLSHLFNGFSVRFEELIKADTINLRFQEVSKMDLSNERRPINVGFGITYILPVLVALLKAKPGDVVIVENPECHLHPKAQRMIGELMAKVANSGVQVIVETHSDHVLNGIRLSVKRGYISKVDTQILFVDREDIGTHYHTNVYAPNIQENGDLDVWPDGFFDEWDNTLLSLLR